MIYRDFVYMDTGRIQSIIAQLEKGVLDKVMEGKSSELQGKASAAAGVLASFLPIGLEGGFSRKTEIQSSKVLHDYAFNIALEALDEHGLYIEVEDWDRENIPLPDAAFILVRGSATMLDYGLLRNLAENEPMLTSLFDKSQQPPQRTRHQGHKQSPQRSGKGKASGLGIIQQIWTLVDALMGDSIQVRLKYSDDILFAGPLSREFLRESTRDLIFKYGGKPQEGWVMLAQASQVTEPFDKLKALTRLTEGLPAVEKSDFSTASDAVNMIVEVLNALQEAMASVSYPAIAVTPIALYRELKSAR
jgi:hypothetical protein